MLNFYYLQRPKLPGVCHFSLYYNYSDRPYLLEQICVLYNPDTIALFYRNAYWLCINILITVFTVLMDSLLVSLRVTGCIRFYFYSNTFS
jgi:hypothetical protein